MFDFDGYSKHPMGLFPATHAIVSTLICMKHRVHMSASVPRDEIIAYLECLDSVKITEDLAQAEVVLCNEFDCPSLDTMAVKTNDNGPASSTLIIQCKSFYRGIVYHTLAARLKKSRKLRCSAFNGPLLHQRQKLAGQNHKPIDLVVVCGKQFFCIPNDIQLRPVDR